MLNDISAVIARADETVRKCSTRDPEKIAARLDIEIIPCAFSRQKGAYKVILKNRFIFIKNDLDTVMRRIVLLHELGHDAMHRRYAEAHGGFEEFGIFDMKDNRMEYEANVFAAQISLPDDEILEYIERGYDVQQIACAMSSDINLVAIKADTLISQGYDFRRQQHSNAFLK